VRNEAGWRGGGVFDVDVTDRSVLAR